MDVGRARREIESRVQQQQQQRGNGTATIRSTTDLPVPSTASPPAAVVGCWTNPPPPAASGAAATSLSGFPDVIVDEFRHGDPLWSRGPRGFRSAAAGFSDLLSSLQGGSGMCGLGGGFASALDGDEGIGSLSPDPLGIDAAAAASPWSRLASLESSSAARRSWIDAADLPAVCGGGADVGRLGVAMDWGGGMASGSRRNTDSSSDSPTDCISVTPPSRSPLACLFG